MKVLIQSATIVNSLSPFHLQTKDLLIENGKITSIEDNINPGNSTLINGKGLFVSAGWFDLYSVVREPGNENKDTLKSLCNSAAFGGFTKILGISGSNPAMYNRSQVEFVKNNSKDYIVDIVPTGTITEKKSGENITEMYDLHLAGALAFSDGKNSIKNPELLKRALLYVKPFNGTIMVYCENEQLAAGGMINEGAVATSLGMKVRPAIAEEIELERNLSIAAYTDSKIHIHSISTEKSVDIIKRAKANGIKVTCDVHLANLYFTDENTSDFDTLYKVLPVLRTKKDVEALIKGLKSGVIDGISSGHTSQEEESKECEFDHAEFGMTNLECMASALYEKLEKQFSVEELALMLSEKSRNILNIKVPEINIKQEAELSIFKLEDWEFKKSDIKSVSKNNPFIGKKFKLKVVGVFNNKILQINS